MRAHGLFGSAAVHDRRVLATPERSTPARLPSAGRARPVEQIAEVEMLQGKWAIVTGSTSGIGLGIARSLGASGAHLMLNGFGDAAQIESLRAGLAREFGVKVSYSGADMSKPDQIRQMVKAAQEELGSADILVNNAGIQHTAPI